MFPIIQISEMNKLQVFYTSWNSPSAVLWTKSQLHLQAPPEILQLSYLPCRRHHRRRSTGHRREDFDRDWARWTWTRLSHASLLRSCGHLSANRSWDLCSCMRGSQKKKVNHTCSDMWLLSLSTCMMYVICAVQHVFPFPVHTWVPIAPLPWQEQEAKLLPGKGNNQLRSAKLPHLQKWKKNILSSSGPCLYTTFRHSFWHSVRRPNPCNV